MENLSSKIYGAKEHNRYYVGRRINYETGKATPETTLNVNYCKLMNKAEVKKVLEEFPEFQVCIINQIRG